MRVWPGYAVVVPAGTRVGEGYVVFLGKGDQLAPSALILMAEEIDRGGEVDLVYGDEDRAEGEDGERVPIFKPDFDLELLKDSSTRRRFANELT